MKHWILSAATALAVAATPFIASAETIRVTLQLPETHSLVQNWRDFAAIVEEKTDGELEFQLFPSAQLFKNKEVPGSVLTLNATPPQKFAAWRDQPLNWRVGAEIVSVRLKRPM